MIKSIFILVAALCIAASSSAFHLTGGEIYYEQVGANEIRIVLKLYRDCNALNGAGFDDPAYVATYQNGYLLYDIPISFSGSIALPDSFNHCLIYPNICLEQATYTAVIFLPPSPSPYTIVYQRCCRNAALSNIETPVSVGMTLFTTFQLPTDTFKNSMPHFINNPPYIACIFQPFRYDNSAVDPDGDSLVYHFAPVYSGANQSAPQPIPPSPPPYDVVPFLPGYSFENPLGVNSDAHLDSATGILTFTPKIIANYELAIAVDEYRNGVYLSTMFRDLQMITGFDFDDVPSINKEKILSVFPNPARDQFIVESGSNAPFNITCYDILGREIFQENNIQRSGTIATNFWDEGMYCIHINSPNGELLNQSLLMVIK